MKRTLLLLALLATVLSGCMDTHEATLTVDFAGYGGGEVQVFEDEVEFDPAVWPSQSFYDRDGATHPDFYTAFDLLVEWAAEGGHDVEAVHDDQFGYYLASIDDQPGEGTTLFWALEVDGEAATVGMEGVEVTDGTHITWTLTDWDA